MSFCAAFPGCIGSVQGQANARPLHGNMEEQRSKEGEVRQPLAGGSELLDLLRRPNKCVNSWKDELMLCFCHPVRIPSPLF